ncbi:MAG: metal ABC transporter permease, partial [Clostridia bacterium]|nr:metal ABC transporter permease [Clostridia bacterium]
MVVLDALRSVTEYLSYPFIRYAFIAGILIALCSSLIGVILVLKRYSFMGDGLSHVAFGALAVATVLRVNNELIIVMPVTIVCAILLLATQRRSMIKGDSALAMLSVGALAVGYLLMNIFPVSSNVSGDVCGTLFGSTAILTLSSADVWICVIMSAVVIGLFVMMYNRIFAVTFDESFASASGIPSGVYNTVLSV